MRSARMVPLYIRYPSKQYPKKRANGMIGMGKYHNPSELLIVFTAIDMPMRIAATKKARQPNYGDGPAGM